MPHLFVEARLSRMRFLIRQCYLNFNRWLLGCWKTWDCFVATFLAMTKDPFSRHCERFEESRGNLRRCGGTFSTVLLPAAWVKVADMRFSRIRLTPGSHSTQGQRSKHHSPGRCHDSTPHIVSPGRLQAFRPKKRPKYSPQLIELQPFRLRVTALVCIWHFPPHTL